MHKLGSLVDGLPNPVDRGDGITAREELFRRGYYVSNIEQSHARFRRIPRPSFGKDIIQRYQQNRRPAVNFDGLS
jgi:hypothetical protein